MSNLDFLFRSGRTNKPDDDETTMGELMNFSMCIAIARHLKIEPEELAGLLADNDENTDYLKTMTLHFAKKASEKLLEKDAKNKKK